MTTETAVHTSSITDLFQVFVDAGPLTAREIAERLSVSEDDVWVCARWMMNAGYLWRDESGRYALSCPWPRIGF
jgi:DNA-binding IclR family transcriptional regulator